MQRTVTITLADWTSLKSLIAAATGGWTNPTFGQYLEIIPSDDNAPTSRVEITSDLANKVPAYRLLPEQSQSFVNHAGRNTISILDKMVRIVDGAGVVTTGTARVILDTA